MLSEKELRNKARQIAKITGENAKELYIKLAEEQDKKEGNK